jgi:hypothetical protein
MSTFLEWYAWGFISGFLTMILIIFILGYFQDKYKKKN